MAEAHRDEADPNDGDPGDDNSGHAQIEGARLKGLVVEKTDEDGDGICKYALQVEAP